MNPFIKRAKYNELCREYVTDLKNKISAVIATCDFYFNIGDECISLFWDSEFYEEHIMLKNNLFDIPICDLANELIKIIYFINLSSVLDSFCYCGYTAPIYEAVPIYTLKRGQILSKENFKEWRKILLEIV